MKAVEESHLRDRVVSTAEQQLAKNQSVSQVEVLNWLGWLPASAIDRWRQGRVATLEETLQVSPEKLARALEIFRAWAGERGLEACPVLYSARTRDRRALQFTARGEPRTELQYRTHWVSPDLSPAKRKRLQDESDKEAELVVVDGHKSYVCASCGEEKHGLLLMEKGGPLCMACADLDHLEYLPAGDAGLTRRAKKASELTAVVVRWSRTRHRYERQGLLVEEQALAAADQPGKPSPGKPSPGKH